MRRTPASAISAPLVRHARRTLQSASETSAAETVKNSAADTIASSSSAGIGAIVATYERSKKSVVWLVKQLDSHLCDLDRRIEERVARRARARAEGDYERIASEQNKLGELCVEHKTRLDSLLFFWVLGGGVSVAGWARAASRASEQRAIEQRIERERADAQASSSSSLGDVQRAEIAAQVEAGVKAALAAMAPLPTPPPPPPPPISTPDVPMPAPPPGESGDENVVARLLAASSWEQCSCAAAVGACVLSAATLVVAWRK